jgi:hypothetical protein
MAVIVSKLMGGLGNQMFQYAVGRYLSIRNQAPLFLDRSFFHLPAGMHTSRNYELGVFDIAAETAGPNELFPFKWFERSGSRAVVMRALANLRAVHYLVDPMDRLDDRIFRVQGNVYLHGYWQSEHYFRPIQQIIRKEFEFRSTLTGINYELKKKISNCNSVSIHVRRGDYLTNPAAQAYYEPTTAYHYQRAVDRIREQDPYPELFVFSDDMDWARTNLRFDLPTTYIAHNQGDRSFIDMQLMAACRHNIMANSSFSWWGAWLNDNPEKIVITPANWFRDRITPPHLLPDRWIRI